MNQDQLIPEALRAADAAKFVIGLQDVGIIGMALLLIVVVGGWMLKRFQADGKGEDARGNLYQQMSDRITNLEGSLTKVVTERDTFLRTNAKLEGRLETLERFERENIVLRDRLEQKDGEIEELQRSLAMKMQEIEELRERVSHLELRYAEKCDYCATRKRAVAAGLAPPCASDEVALPGPNGEGGQQG